VKRHATSQLPAGPFRYFNTSPEVIRLMVMIYVRFPLSLGVNVGAAAGNSQLRVDCDQS
jgi:hypothetical protein